VAGVGIYPHALFLYDLATGTVHSLERGGLDVYWCVADQARNELFVVGEGGASLYTFEMEASRTLRYRFVTRRRSGLVLMSTALLPDRSLWAATADGALVKIAAGALDGTPSGVGRARLGTR
jgi:hypothetical protein